MLTLSELLLNIKIFEGFRHERYSDCGAGVPTIGYGFTASCFSDGKVPATISKEQADVILEDLVVRTSTSVHAYLKKWGYDDGEIEVLLYPLTDFTYNCGVGNLATLTQRGSRSIDEILKYITQYNKAGGKVLAGLTNRRKWEYDEIKKNLAEGKSPQFQLKNYTVADLQTRVNNFYGTKVLKVDNIFGKNTLSYTMAVLDSLMGQIVIY